MPFKCSRKNMSVSAVNVCKLIRKLHPEFSCASPKLYTYKPDYVDNSEDSFEIYVGQEDKDDTLDVLHAAEFHDLALVN